MDTVKNSKNPFLNQVAAVIDECFEAVDNLKEVDQIISTEDIFDAIQAIYPGEHYSAATIADLMHELGYRFTALKSPTMQFVWLIKRR